MASLVGMPLIFMHRYFRPSSSDLFDITVRALDSVRRDIRYKLKANRSGGLMHTPVPGCPKEGKSKEILFVDKYAEDACAEFLLRPEWGLQEHLLVLGEETLWRFEKRGLDLSRQTVTDPANCLVEQRPERRLVAILDMVDGSDLLERDFENWCSAVVMFDPSKKPPKILFSAVHDSRQRIYGANETEAFLIQGVSKASGLDCEKEETIYEDPVPLKFPSTSDDQAICFYGQKHEHFNTIPIGLHVWLERLPAAQRKRVRIYNLAGNPMMTRLANGENVHAVFEHRGQFPHDVIPGAYIALKAGASLVDFEGQAITEQMLAEKLLTPCEGKLKYVLAHQPELASQLAEALRETVKMFYKCSDSECSSEGVRERSAAPLCSICGKQMIPYERRQVAGA